MCHIHFSTINSTKGKIPHHPIHLYILSLNFYSCFSTFIILGLQSHDKAAMLVVNTTEFFSRIYMKMEFTSHRPPLANQQWNTKKLKDGANSAVYRAMNEF